MKPYTVACAVGLIGLLCLPLPLGAQPSKPGTAAQPGVLPATIPIFPLQDVMLFPNVARPLLIFEPRYRAMVADALKGDRIIGMVMLRPGHEAEYEGRPPVFAIGCAGTITEVEQLPDGRYTILLQGSVKFRITGEDQSRAYRLARVEAMPERLNDEEQAALRAERQRLVSVLADILTPGTKLPPPAFPDVDLVNTISQYVDIEPVDRQNLLERDGPLARSRALIELLEKR
jgi:Lon protease-like protein